MLEHLPQSSFPALVHRPLKQLLCHRPLAMVVCRQSHLWRRGQRPERVEGWGVGIVWKRRRVGRQHDLSYQNWRLRGRKGMPRLKEYVYICVCVCVCKWFLIHSYKNTCIKWVLRFCRVKFQFLKVFWRKSFYSVPSFKRLFLINIFKVPAWWTRPVWGCHIFYFLA